MQRLIALRWVRAHRNVAHLQNVTYSDRSRAVKLLLQLVVKLLLQLENKQQIIQNNVETHHKHMYSFHVQLGSMCNIAFPMARFICIVTSQVFVKI